jgi:hypothetical protein
MSRAAPKKRGVLLHTPQKTADGDIEYRIQDFRQVKTAQLRAYQKSLRKIAKICEHEQSESFWNLTQILARLDVEIQRRES